MRISGLSVAVFCALWTPQTVAAAKLPLDHDWYTVEVLIFENTTASEAPSEAPAEVPAEAVPGARSDTQKELLSTSARRAYPANLLAPAMVDATDPGGGFAPLDATAEPWPQPPPPAGDEWFDEAETDPGAELDEPGVVEEPLDDPTGSEPPADELTGPAEPAPTPRQLLEQAYADALADFQTTLAADAYHWRSDPTQLGLTSEAASLTRRAVGRVLLHGAWLQPVPERGSPEPILIQSNEAIADRWRIEGTVAITLGRFLHVAAELWYQPDPSPTQIRQTAESASGWFSLTDDPNQDVAVLAGIPFDLDEAVDPGLPYQVLSELRRMRSGELHYLDHPSFGMLIRVIPVEPPLELTALLEQLEEAVE